MGLIGKHFNLGKVVVTPSILERISESEQFVALNKHANCDWGNDLSDEDRLENENCLLHGGRLLSVYKTNNKVKFYIITEADRSSTTLLMPEDY